MLSNALRTLTIAMAIVLTFPTDAYAQRSLFSDIKAQQVGDALTITLAERTAAQRESQWRRQDNSRLGGGGGISSTDISGRFGVDATFDNQASKRNESVQSDLLRGTMTAMVTGIDSLSGNLIIQGERSLNVNGETHIMKVQGIVRPIDIMSNNAVYSYQLANAVIEYKRDGGFKRKLMGPGTLIGLAAVASIGAAVLIGSTSSN